MTHLLVGWNVSNVARLERRDRAIVTLAGVIPDIDGFGIIADFVTAQSDHPLYWYGSYHHLLGHNLAFGAVVAAAALCLGKRRVLVTVLAGISFHLHLLGDLVGSRGPDVYQWPIPYLQPFTEAWQLVWVGQWELDAWPNFAVTAALLASTLYLAWKRGSSPVELVSPRADAAFVRILRARFGEPNTPG
jgi:hypothetical protein